jgi:hypothetical protein
VPPTLASATSETRRSIADEFGHRFTHRILFKEEFGSRITIAAPNNGIEDSQVSTATGCAHHREASRLAWEFASPSAGKDGALAPLTRIRIRRRVGTILPRGA